MKLISTRKLRRWYATQVTYRNHRHAGTLPYDWQKIGYSRTEIVRQACAITKAVSYLEIGCFRNENFDAISVAHKIGVDPEQGGTHRMTSDDFFAGNKEKFDVIFIDGLHHYEQVHKDIVNSLQALKKGGIIVLDDLMPLNWKEEHRTQLSGAWTGDCWKCSFEIAATQGLDFKVLLCGNGTGVIKPQAKYAPLADLSGALQNERFAYFYENYKKLPLISAEQGVKWMQKSTAKT